MTRAMNFVLTPDLVIPFIVSNALAIWILWLTFRKPNVAEAVLAILFLGAGCFNIYTALSNPGVYVAFAETSFVPFYKDFISGFFASHTIIIISLIAVGQLFVGFSMLLENPRVKFGCLGGILFSLAIAPLGAGSAFPSTLILAVAFLILFLNKEVAPDTSAS